MMTQLARIVVDCPTCGRPIDIAAENVGRQIACGHCRGTLVAFENRYGESTAVACRETDLLFRADRLLNIVAKRKIREREAVRPTVVIAESRDEVFARLAADLADAGMRVVRAKSAVEAMRRCVQYKPTLVVANVGLADESGWLLVAKLRLFNPALRVWLYQSRTSAYEKAMGTFLRIENMLDDAGDLLGLSETIVRTISNQGLTDDSTISSSELSPI